MEGHALPLLIRDLAVILMTAGITSLVFRWLKQPVILGYILAGVLVGPYLPWWASVSDVENIKVWGEIGVIFVLFTLGLEFSFRRLLQLGGPAVVTGVIETSIVMALGVLFGQLFGWSLVHSVFLGGVVAISSTTVVLKIFEDMRFKGRKFAQLVFGVLIVEDLVAILLLVLLSTTAITSQFNGMELAYAVLRLSFFIILWFVVGLFILPRLMRALSQLLSEETALIFSVGLCLFMVLIATKSGFSPALGAFVMGSLLAESSQGQRLERILHPLKDFFGAIFFVSVGMLLDPSTLPEIWPKILILTMLVVVGKSFGVGFGALVAGQSLSTAVRAGLSLTQIGEFSFILAGVGMALGVIEKSLYPLAVSVSILTTFLTPHLLKQSETMIALIGRALSPSLRQRIERYQSLTQSQSSRALVPKILRGYFPILSINFVLLVATTWALRRVAYPEMEVWFGNSAWVRLLAAVLNLVLCVPFLWGLSWREAGGKWASHRENFDLFWVEKIITSGRIIIGVIMFLTIISQYFGWRALSGVTFVILLALVTAFWRYGGGAYRKLEQMFLGQLESGWSKSGELLVPWDAQLSEIRVATGSVICGQSVDSLNWSKIFEVMIVAIDRGARRILAPRASEIIFPHDVLFVLGREENVDNARVVAEGIADGTGHNAEAVPLRLESLILTQQSFLCGKTIRDSKIRDLVNGLVVGVEKGSHQQLNPPAEMILESGDRLWIVGDPQKIHELRG